MKKTLCVLLGSLFLLSSLVPCAVASDNEIVIAIDTTKPPMQFMDDRGNISGFEIDFIKAMAREAGFTAVFKKIAWEDIFEGLSAGRYDAICPSVSITEERKMVFSFTQPYINIAQAVIVSEKSTIQKTTDLHGRKIAVKSGTTSLKAAEQISDVTIVEYPVVEQAIQALQKGEVDAVVCDGPVAAFYVSQKQNRGVKIAALLPSSNQEQYGMVVRSDDKKTLALLNKGIMLVKRQLIDIDLQKKWLAALFSIE